MDFVYTYIEGEIFFCKLKLVNRREVLSLYRTDIPTDYGLDGPGIETRWRRDFPPIQTGPGALPAFCTMGTVSFPGVNCGRGVLLTTHPLLAPRSWKSRAIPLPSLPPPPVWATTGPVTGLLYLYRTNKFNKDNTELEIKIL
jgi:hypothetical protein